MMQADLTLTVDLEPMELDCLLLAAQGHDDEVIAARLGITFETVRQIFGGLFLNSGHPVNLATLAHDGFITVKSCSTPIALDRKKAVGT